MEKIWLLPCLTSRYCNNTRIFLWSSVYNFNFHLFPLFSWHFCFWIVCWGSFVLKLYTIFGHKCIDLLKIIPHLHLEVMPLLQWMRCSKQNSKFSFFLWTVSRYPINWESHFLSPYLKMDAVYVSLLLSSLQTLCVSNLKNTKLSSAVAIQSP